MLFKRKISLNSIFLITVALIFSTVLRVSLLFIYPLLALAFIWLFNFRVSKNGISLILLVIIAWLFSFRNGIYLKFNLVSFYYYLTFLLLLFARPTVRSFSFDPLYILRISLSIFVFINNCFGLIQYIRLPDDDSFVGIYGKFTVTQNGLVLLNTVLFFWYLQLYFQTRRKFDLFASFFFLVCMVLGFYGAGLIVLFGAILLFYVKLNVSSVLKVSVIAIVFGVIVYFLMDLISPRTLEYNFNIIKKFWNASPETAPRKLIIFYRYITGYPRHILDFLFGSGPGTFNSRSAFMVGSPSYFNVNFVKSDLKPEYFNTLAYPLWNPSVVTRFDGFMSQPFSSLLAFLGEYGAVVVGLFFLEAHAQFRRVVRFAQMGPGNRISLEGKLFRFFSFLLLLLCVVDNYIEYPEVVGLILVIIKLIERKIYEAAHASSAIEQAQQVAVS